MRCRARDYAAPVPAIVIVGAQWGDEGKGKIIDVLAERAAVVARYQGGSNAGHTVFVGEEEFKFRLLPSGVLNEDALCVLGNGVVQYSGCAITRALAGVATPVFAVGRSWAELY